MQGAGRHPGEVWVGGRPELTLDVRLQLPGEPRLQRGLAENDRQRPDPHPWSNGRVHAAACGWGRLSDTRPALSHSQEPHWWRLCCQRLAQCGQEGPELGDHGGLRLSAPCGQGPCLLIVSILTTPHAPHNPDGQRAFAGTGTCLARPGAASSHYCVRRRHGNRRTTEDKTGPQRETPAKAAFLTQRNQSRGSADFSLHFCYSPTNGPGAKPI